MSCQGVRHTSKEPSVTVVESASSRGRRRTRPEQSSTKTRRGRSGAAKLVTILLLLALHTIHYFKLGHDGLYGATRVTLNRPPTIRRISFSNYHRVVFLDGDLEPFQQRNRPSNNNLVSFELPGPSANITFSKQAVKRYHQISPDPHCKPLDWQATVHPICNTLHERGMQSSLIDEALAFLAEGSLREAWQYKDPNSNSSTIMKTLGYS